MLLENEQYSIDRTFIDFPSEEDDAYIVYLRGCEHHCDGCHSPSLQEFVKYSPRELVSDIVDLNLKSPMPTYKIVISGGDPLHVMHRENTKILCRMLSNARFSVCIYTGYDSNEIEKCPLEGVSFYKFGRYKKEITRMSGKDDEGMTLASPNQDFYDGKLNKISNNGKLLWRKYGK